MYRIKNKLIFIIIGIIAACNIVGCSSSDDEENDNTSSYVIPTKNIDINVTLPLSSPITEEEASIYVQAANIPIAVGGLTKVTTASGKDIDISLLLPARAGESGPTVYLSATVVPGEVDIQLDAEETALWLVLQNVNRKYLQDPELAFLVKTIARDNASNFIDYFKIAILADPYLLRTDNIENVLGVNFVETVLKVNTILANTFAPDSIPAPATASLRSSATEIDVSASNRVVIKPEPEWLSGRFYLSDLSENGQYTDYLNFWNLSSLPALYRVTDTATGEVIKELPTGTVTDIAFSPEIFGPADTLFNVRLPSYETVISSMKNVQIEIYTPGLKEFDSSIYSEADSPSTTLLIRSAYSYVFIPILSDTLSAKLIGELGNYTFTVFQKANVFENLLPFWTSGDFSGGLHSLKNNITVAMLETILTQAITDFIDAKAVAAIIATKFTAYVPSAISVYELQQGLEKTPSKITYYVTYPVGIQDIRPVALKKVESYEQSPELTLRGHGLKPFMFQGAMRYPSIKLDVYDKEHNLLDSKTIDYQHMSIADDGAEIDFSLPIEMIEKDTINAYVRLQLNHAYVEIDWLLGEITDYFDKLQAIQLPVTEGRIKEFTVYLSSELLISDTDLHWKEPSAPLTIFGEGFHSSNSGFQNKVFFEDKSISSPIESAVTESSDKEILTRTPSSLSLDYGTIGNTFLYVELEDGSQSNPYPLKIYPTPPYALSQSGFVYKGQIIKLSQKESVPIFYSLNGSSHIPYEEPIEITQTTALSAYALIEIDGIRYPSRTSSFRYETCDKGETFIPYPHGAQCVVIQNQHLIPTRYCPVKQRDYNGYVSSDFYGVDCFYDLGVIKTERHTISIKSEDGSSQTVLAQLTNFWTQPEGRPMFVNLGVGRYYSLCPNGSFIPVNGGCSH